MYTVNAQSLVTTPGRSAVRTVRCFSVFLLDNDGTELFRFDPDAAALERMAEHGSMIRAMSSSDESVALAVAACIEHCRQEYGVEPHVEWLNIEEQQVLQKDHELDMLWY